jgi:hypothetical protein
VVAEDAEARAHSEDQSLEIGKVGVARAADVGRREQREDILGGLRQLPELRRPSLVAWGSISRAEAYTSPVCVVGGDLPGLRQAEDALLEAEFGVGGAHRDACHITCSLSEEEVEL